MVVVAAVAVPVAVEIPTVAGVVLIPSNVYFCSPSIYFLITDVLGVFKLLAPGGASLSERAPELV